MYLIGYIYKCISIKYNLSGKNVYKLFNDRGIIKYYNICHIFHIVDTGARMMERLMYTKRLIEYLGKVIKVIIDRPIGYDHNGIIYSQNYGYTMELIAPDEEYQDVYIIGVDKPLKSFKGKVIGIVNRLNDIEDKLVVCDINKNFTKEEIKELVNFQEKYFKSKLIIK